MLHVLNAREMKSCDEVMIREYGIPSLVLMEKAALGVFDFITERFSSDTNVGIFCGPGNNGGDGIAVGRMLFDHGYDVKLYFPAEASSFSADAKAQYKIAKKYGIYEAVQPEELADCDLLVDALFGTGLARPIEGKYLDLVRKMNEMKGFMLAVDMPSGISADDGSVLGEAVQADATVTFAFYKMGQLLYPGKDFCKVVFLCDIGISQRAFSDRKPGVLSPEDKDIASLLPKRKDHSHKGTYGKVLVIAGSHNMAGAAVLSAKAVYLMGAGLVKVYTPECNRMILQTALPETVLCTYEDRLDETALSEALDWADVVLMGPGLGTETLQKKMVTYVMEHAQTPMVIDADGLNLLAKDVNLLKRPHMDLVLTPHLMEMSRLLSQPIAYIKDHPLLVAEEFSRENDVIITLKDAVTVTTIPYMQSYLNRSGNHGMATAGSGDVLSGIITGLIATGAKASDAAFLGVYLHGKCGDNARKRMGSASVMARHILDEIPVILQSYDQ